MNGFTQWLISESEMHGLLAGALKSYFDPAAFLVLADWFEERGDPMADYIRHAVDIIAANPQDRAAIAQGPIRTALNAIRPSLEQAGIAHDEGITYDYMFRGPHPTTGKSQVRYRLVGNQVEAQLRKPIGWYPLQPQDIPEAVVKMVIIARLRELYAYGMSSNDDPVIQASQRQISRCIEFLRTHYLHSLNARNLCVALRADIDNIEGLTRRLEYYVTNLPGEVQMPQGGNNQVWPWGPNLVGWLLQRWDDPSATNRGLPGQIVACNLDRSGLATRLAEVLQIIQGNQSSPGV